MVTNVTSLLKTVKAVEDEHTRGTRALESTIEAIAQEIRVRSYSFLSFYIELYITTCFTMGQIGFRFIGSSALKVHPRRLGSGYQTNHPCYG